MSIGGAEHLATILCDFCYNCVNRCCVDEAVKGHAVLVNRADSGQVVLRFCSEQCVMRWRIRQQTLQTRTTVVIFQTPQCP